MDVTGRVAKTLIDLTNEPDAMTHPLGTQIRISRQEIQSRSSAARVKWSDACSTASDWHLIAVSGKTIVVLGRRADPAETGCCTLREVDQIRFCKPQNQSTRRGAAFSARSTRRADLDTGIDQYGFAPQRRASDVVRNR